jgi:hypothetical protein
MAGMKLFATRTRFLRCVHCDEEKNPHLPSMCWQRNGLISMCSVCDCALILCDSSNKLLRLRPLPKSLVKSLQNHHVTAIDITTRATVTAEMIVRINRNIAILTAMVANDVIITKRNTQVIALGEAGLSQPMTAPVTALGRQPFSP